MANITKQKVRDFESFFRERIIEQLNHELEITETQEIALRAQIGVIELCKSNNDKKIIGTINHHVASLTYNNTPMEYWGNDLEISSNLNDDLLSTQIQVTRNYGSYFQAREAMRALITEKL